MPVGRAGCPASCQPPQGVLLQPVCVTPPLLTESWKLLASLPRPHLSVRSSCYGRIIQILFPQLIRRSEAASSFG